MKITYETSIEEPPRKGHFKECIMAKIIKTQYCSRGYGSMTAALFQTEQSKYNGWDYVEVVYDTHSGYQRDCCALSAKDAKSLIGKTIEEIEKNDKFRVLSGKWHRPEIDENGNIISLKC